MNLDQQIREEERAIARLQRKSERGKAHAAALEYEHRLEHQHANDPDFLTWNRNRALNLQDFDYLFYHRCRFSEPIRADLEVIAAKITHIKKDGEDGYFKKLERNVGWTKHITPLVICRVNYADKLVRCNIWSHAGNSGRCHKPDCPCCHWNDILCVQLEAFGSDSRTFERMKQRGLTGFFITIGYTTNPANSKAVGRDFHDEDIAFRPGEAHYDPYPVRLGLSDDSADGAWLGYQDAKILGLVAQQAMERTYKKKLTAGYHFKLEGAFKLVPGGANRANLHAHAFANGHENDPQVLANALMSQMRRGLRQYRKHLHGSYSPDVLVLRLGSAQEIHRVVRYCEKVIPFGLIVEEAMERPEAKFSNGRWNPQSLDDLRTALIRLVNDDIPMIFSGSADPLFQALRRRKTVGNMRFSDRGTCIGDEPVWHQRQRRKRAEDQRERKQKKKKQQEGMDTDNKPARKRTPRKPRNGIRQIPRRTTQQPAAAHSLAGSEHEHKAAQQEKPRCSIGQRVRTTLQNPAPRSPVFQSLDGHPCNSVLVGRGPPRQQGSDGLQSDNPSPEVESTSFVSCS